MLQQPLADVPLELAGWQLELEESGHNLIYRFDANAEDTGIPALLRRIAELGIEFRDLDTARSSLEDIFVSLVERAA